MIDREDYRLFLAIADTGSLSRAAKLLHLTPSAVSRRLRDMETRLNVRLVNRTTRVLQLTQAGERFCIASRRVIAAMEDAESSIQELLHPVTGVLRLTSTPGFGCMVLPGLLAAFVQNYPGIQVELATSHEPTNLTREGYDVAIHSGELEDSGLTARALMTNNPIHICAAPAYLERHGVPTSLVQLLEHDLLLPSGLGHGYTERMRRAYFGELDWDKVNKRMMSNDLPALQAAARAGLGITFLSMFMVRDDLAAGHLVSLLPNLPKPKWPVHLLFFGDTNLPAKTRAFIEFSVAYCERMASDASDIKRLSDPQAERID
jgi:LysR family transcriptional activator of dmlA